MQHIDLPRTRMPGRQHTHKSADVGVPDIAIAIDNHAERPGIITGERKDLDVAVAQPPEARTAHHAEPDVTIGSHGNTADDDVARLRYPAPPSIARTQDSEIGANQQVGRIAWIDRNDERALRNSSTSAFNQAAPRSRERNTPP